MKDGYLSFSRRLIAGFFAVAIANLAWAQSPEFQNELESRAIQRKVFSHVESASWAMSIISLQAQRDGWSPLSENCLRFVVQPFGIVEKAFEVDIDERKVTVYPGTHDIWKSWEFEIERTKLEAILHLLKSEEFRKMPREILPQGPDGYSIFLEGRISQESFWKLHWCPEEGPVRESLSILEKESDRLAREMGQGSWENEGNLGSEEN